LTLSEFRVQRGNYSALLHRDIKLPHSHENMSEIFMKIDRLRINSSRPSKLSGGVAYPLVKRSETIESSRAYFYCIRYNFIRFLSDGKMLRE
jgi:hypothetical protein